MRPFALGGAGMILIGRLALCHCSRASTLLFQAPPAIPRGLWRSRVTALSCVAGSPQVQDLNEQIKEVGNAIRVLKEGGASKEEVQVQVTELLSLKSRYQELTGEAFGVDAKKAEKDKAKEAKKAARKAEKEAKMAAKLAKSQAQAANPLEGLQPLTYGQGEMPSQTIGDYEMVMSRGESLRQFRAVHELQQGLAKPGDRVWVRARVHTVRAKGGSAFMVLRGEGGSTVQALKFRAKGEPEAVEDSKRLIKYVGGLPLEAVVDVYGELAAADVKSCTVADMELVMERCHAVSRADAMLPFLVEDAARSEDEVEASQLTDRPYPRLGQELRLDNRWLDLRTPANTAIMRVQSAVCQLFREGLYQQGFIEIHTPKLIPGESEGGADVFSTDYFGKTACLAQSPQLYKQMAVSGGLGRVFEVGPVFRAENSNTRRHLCEFTGLDLEMPIQEHYNEVIRVLHGMFKVMFQGLEERFATDLATIREQYVSEPVAFTEEPCVLHWEEGLELLRAAGHDPGQFDDLTGAHELTLGGLVKEKYGTDFFFLDRYPAAVRPFYTMPCADDSNYSNSYDVFIRGQEICSGAQRCHDPELVTDIIKAKGLPIEPLTDYVKAFRHGCPPHGGAGIGLERVVFLYLGLDNVRKASLFPRDPNRCTP